MTARKKVEQSLRTHSSSSSGLQTGWAVFLHTGWHQGTSDLADKAGDAAVQYQYIRCGYEIDARVAHADGGKIQADLRSTVFVVYCRRRDRLGKSIGKEWSDGEAPPVRLRHLCGSFAAQLAIVCT